MRFGLTTAERNARRPDKGKPWEWHPAPFKLLPVRLMDGSWAWLEKLERCSHVALHLPLSAHPHHDRFVYRVASKIDRGGSNA